jgi:hypothetical protein
MTSTPRAERFAAYLAELEAYIAQNGHLPAPDRATPRTDKPRLQRMLASARTGADVKLRIGAVLATPSWQQRRKTGDTAPAKIDRLGAYLSGLETYVTMHGHLPSTGRSAVPRLKRAGLQRHLASPATDAATKERITGLLGKPPYKTRSPHAISVKTRVDLVDNQMSALAEAAVTLPGLSTRQADTLAWILQHRRLPTTGSSNNDERILGTRLAASLRSALAGTARAHTAAFVLAVPNLAAGADRTRIRELADAKEAVRQESLRAREATKTRLGPLEDRWNKGFAELSAWVEAHGELPRRRTSNPDEYRVANWVNVQRVQFRDNNLAAGWVERLRTVPGALDPKPRMKGDLAFARSIADFHAAHGRLPRADVPAPEGTAGIHLLKLWNKNRDGLLGSEPLEILAAIPGALNRGEGRKTPRQRLAELEEYVKTTGQFPVQGAQGLSNWAYRALRGQGSRYNPAESREIREQVMALRASVPYTRMSRADKFPAYLEAPEGYIHEHGHVPPTTVDAELRMSRQRLLNFLENPQTDELTRARIRAVLAAAPYRRAAA